MKKVTEQASLYTDIEKKSIVEILRDINTEDLKVAQAVGEVLEPIAKFLDEARPRFVQGGRLFYVGAGTSGRLGVIDASECPPTFGVDFDRVIGLIAGGDGAIRKAVEFAEDDLEQGWRDLKEYGIRTTDIVVGLAASGTTPYVIGAVDSARKHGILTAAITCNPNSPLANVVDHPLEIVVGPEYITGSTRMKAGTAQKMVLNMISTTLMIKLGRVQGNKMVDMKMANNKLVDRGTRMIIEHTGWDYQQAKDWLVKYDSVREALEDIKKKG